MIDKKDARWWIAEAQQHPDKAADLIRMLAERLAFLDQQNEELRGEVIELRRKLRGAGASVAEPESVAQLQQRVQALETALHQPGAQGARHLLVTAPGQIVANIGYQAALANGIGKLSRDVSNLTLLVAPPTARLIAFADDARVFQIDLTDLPVPDGGPIALTPGNIAMFIDQAALETCRYVVLVSVKGYAYSVLSGTVNRMAPGHEKILRNLVPDDPIVAAYPSNNAELFAVSRRGRWLRFPEKSIGGTGALMMELPKNDRFASLVWMPGETMLYFVSADGKLFARRTSDLPARRVPGKAAQPFLGDHEIVAVGSGPEVSAITSSGAIVTAITRNLPPRAEGLDGVPLPALPAGDTVVAATFH